MADGLLKSIRRWRVERKSLKESPPPPQFPPGALITSPLPFKISMLNADYLYIYPMMAAVLTSPAGVQHFPTKGGHVDLPPGAYKLQYINLQEHIKHLPSIQSPTADSSLVTLTTTITWQVVHPSGIIKKDRPLENLFDACTAAVKNFIRSHTHDELVSGKEGGSVSDEEISRWIVQQVSQEQAGKGFHLDVRVQDRQGDPKLIEIQQARLLQEKKTLSEKEKLEQERYLIDQREAVIRRQADVDKLKVEQEVSLEKIRTDFEARRAEIMVQIQARRNQVDSLRRDPQMQHDEAIKALDVRAKGYEALMHAISQPGFPHNLEEARLLEEYLQSLPDLSLPSTPPVERGLGDGSGSALSDLLSRKR